MLNHLLPANSPAIDQALLAELPLQPADKLRLILANPVNGVLGLIFGAAIPSGSLYSKILMIKFWEEANPSVFDTIQMGLWLVVTAIGGALSLNSVFCFWKDLQAEGADQNKDFWVRIFVCLFFELWWLLADPGWSPTDWAGRFTLYFPCSVFVLIILTNALTMGAATAARQRFNQLRHQEKSAEPVEALLARHEAEKKLLNAELARVRAWFSSVDQLVRGCPATPNGASVIVIDRDKTSRGYIHSIKLRPSAAASASGNSAPVILSDPLLQDPTRIGTP